jgi:inner membrane protein
LIAASIILVLVTLYAKAIFKSNLLTGLTFGVLAILYTFFYSLLQLQDYALLMGSFGLLLILAVIMYLTRKIDWYSFNTDDN